MGWHGTSDCCRHASFDLLTDLGLAQWILNLIETIEEERKKFILLKN